MTSPAPTTVEASTKIFRLGAIGVDSSHLPEFSRRIGEMNAAGKTPCRVTAFYTDGRHDLPADQVAAWVDTTQQLGAARHESMDAMLDAVDGVLVLSVNGNKHLAHATQALERGLPTYIDKPLTCSAEEAMAIRDLAAKHGAPCYSASSLRFASEVTAIRDADLGEVVAVDAFGPGELHPLMPGTFYYGVHTVEMVDAIWGPGVEAVSARHATDRDTIELRYHDGRAAHLRLERAGSYDFGATVHGRKSLQSFKVDFATVYDRLVAGMARFFDEGIAPVSLDDIVENIRVMEAANASMRRDGAWVTLGS